MCLVELRKMNGYIYGLSFSLTCFGELQLLDDPSKEKSDKVDKVLEDENMTLDKLEDFVELVTSYRCRICPFTTPDQKELIQHFKLQHVQVIYQFNL